MRQIPLDFQRLPLVIGGSTRHCRDMPRKNSKRSLIAKGARWLEWRCGAKWQNIILINTGYYRLGAYEALIDSLIAAGIWRSDRKERVNREKIEKWLENWSLERLEELAAVAERIVLFHDGRPWEAYDPELIGDVEDKISRGMSERNACRQLVRKYGGSPEAVRQLYLKAKKNQIL